MCCGGVSLPYYLGGRYQIETYVFESVQVLVPLVAEVALEGLLLLHAQAAGIRRQRLGIDDGEGAVVVLVQRLRVVAVGLVVPVWVGGSVSIFRDCVVTAAERTGGAKLT